VTSLGDRSSLDLPPVQLKLMQAVQRIGKPVILVLMNGSAVSVQWAQANIPAIIESWYPGQAGGTAVAEAIFGLTNPGGRLPVTFYKSVDDLPAFDDYRMANRTYRYFQGEPLYPFGFGLSYTTFAYRDLKLSSEIVRNGDPVSLSVEVENTGGLQGDEVVQVYVQDAEASAPVPKLQLQGFSRVRLAAGEKKVVSFTLQSQQMKFADSTGAWVLEPGVFKVWVGGGQPNIKGGSPSANVLEGQFIVMA
jgi:beta-glucosidase